MQKFLLAGAGVVLLGITAAAPEPRLAPAIEAQRSSVPPLSDSAFVQLIARVSEPGGFFDSDNLISNEATYLYPIPKMKALGVAGGVYVGVGPDQNYSYIAQVKPAIAFMLDIRRDAALQHLLYKSLFKLSRNRLEYLCLLFARPLPAKPDEWKDKDLRTLLAYIDSTDAQRVLLDSTIARVRKGIAAIGHTVSDFEYQTIQRIQAEFFRWGLDLQYTSLNRPARRSHPSFRSLVIATTEDGEALNYLAHEADFQVLKAMHQQNLIVPVTGDLSGSHAVREIARYMEEQELAMSVLYVSNVEFYLWREGNFASFAENVLKLPRNGRSVVVRSYFYNTNTGYMPPDARPGAASAQLMTTLNDFADEYKSGGFRTYLDLISKHNRF